MKTRKAVFLDIDGTLTTFEGQLPQSAGEALQKCAENGHELVLCTGRTITQIYSFLRQSGWFSGIISGSGSDVRRKGEQVYLHELSARQLKQVLDYLEERRICYFLQGTNGVYTVPWGMDEAIHSLAPDLDEAERERRFGKIYCVDDPYSLTDIQKLCYYNAPVSVAQMASDLGRDWDVLTSSYELTQSSDGEITCHRINKEFGILRYLDASGIRLEDTIAFGDGPNDYEMLSCASMGVAMGNAGEGLKKLADRVTDAVDKDGLYHGFSALGLI